MMRGHLAAAMLAASFAPAYGALTPEAERERRDGDACQPPDREPSKWAQDRRKAIDAKRMKRGRFPA